MVKQPDLEPMHRFCRIILLSVSVVDFQISLFWCNAPLFELSVRMNCTPFSGQTVTIGINLRSLWCREQGVTSVLRNGPLLRRQGTKNYACLGNHLCLLRKSTHMHPLHYMLKCELSTHDYDTIKSWMNLSIGKNHTTGGSTSAGPPFFQIL